MAPAPAFTGPARATVVAWIVTLLLFFPARLAGADRLSRPSCSDIGAAAAVLTPTLDQLS